MLVFKGLMLCASFSKVYALYQILQPETVKNFLFLTGYVPILCCYMTVSSG